MSVHAVELALYELGVKKEVRAAFAQDADALLARYQLAADEVRMLKAFDVRGLQRKGASPLLTLGYWMMNEPSRSRASYLHRLRDETSS